MGSAPEAYYDIYSFSDFNGDSFCGEILSEIAGFQQEIKGEVYKLTWKNLLNAGINRNTVGIEKHSVRAYNYKNSPQEKNQAVRFRNWSTYERKQIRCHI